MSQKESLHIPMSVDRRVHLTGYQKQSGAYIAVDERRLKRHYRGVHPSTLFVSDTPCGY